MMSMKKRCLQIFKYLFVLIFWLVIWHFLSKNIDNSIFLPTPKNTFKSFLSICAGEGFYEIIFNSFFRIVKGFILAVICGFVLSVISYFIGFIEILITPVMKLIKTVPVASFVILALLWIDSLNLSTLISFMMVLPVIYINIFQSFKGVDRNILEMTKVFEVSIFRKIRFIYIPEIFPAFIAACKIGLGFSFKAGIAAEIIGLPVDSIGWKLYQSKLYLMTDEMFAWTIVIILISIFFEGICIYLLNKLSMRVLRVNLKENKLEKNIDNLEKTDKKIEASIDNKSTKNLNSEKSKISFKNISKSYGKNRVLDNINVEFDNITPTCIMGASGIGKTTLIKILLGLINQDDGIIKIETDEALKNNEKKFKRAAVFQEDRLIEEADIYTNIFAVLGHRVSTDTIDKHLAELGLEEMADKKVKELSGGMKRRVEIMRAVLSDADMYVFDEAFKGLDSKNRDITIDYVKKYTLGKILVFVSHDINESEKFNAKVVRLNES